MGSVTASSHRTAHSASSVVEETVFIDPMVDPVHEVGGQLSDGRDGDNDMHALNISGSVEMDVRMHNG